MKELIDKLKNLQARERILHCIQMHKYYRCNYFIVSCSFICGKVLQKVLLKLIERFFLFQLVHNLNWLSYNVLLVFLNAAYCEKNECV